MCEGEQFSELPFRFLVFSDSVRRRYMSIQGTIPGYSDHGLFFFKQAKTFLPQLLCCWLYFANVAPFCAQNDKVCDGTLDCADGSDELCDHACVPGSYNGIYTMKVRILKTRKKIVRRDSDEFHLQNNPVWTYFQMCTEDSRKCVPISWLCNGKVDCPKGSDEQNCICKGDHMMECTLKNNRKECLPKSWICKGHVSCQENNEHNCNTPQERDGPKMCDSNHFWCRPSNLCLPRPDICSCADMEETVFCKGQVAAW